MRFHQLFQAAKVNKLSATLYQFDCGETVTIRNGQGVLFRASKECGEEPNAIDVTGAWLLAEGFIKEHDIPAPRPDRD